MVFNNDSIASAGIFLSRQLEQRLPKLYEKKYPALKFANGLLLPATADLEIGAESVVAELVETVGVAEEIADYSSTLTLADAAITEERFQVSVKAVGIRYSVRELLAAQKGNRNVRGMREMAARRALDEATNRLCAFGERRRGITGMLSDPNVPVASNIATSLYDYTAMSADDVINYLSGLVTKVVKDSNLAEEPDTMLVPVQLHERISNQRLPNSPDSIKTFFLNNNPYIRNIESVNELSSDQLEANGVNPVGTNRDMIFIYAKSPDVVRRFYEPMTVLPPQLNSLVYTVIFMQASTSAVFHYPGSCIKALIPKAV